MASAYLSDVQVVHHHRTSAAADTALSAFEKDMFGASLQTKAHEQSNEANPDSLSYLFSIFAY